MKNVALLALGLLPCAAIPCAMATDAQPDWQVTFNAGAQTDYVFRGISQTDGHPAGFAGADVTYLNQWYVGAWTSNVDFSPSGDTRTSQEVDLYGGWRPVIGGIALDLGYIYYGYRNQPEGLRESYAETYLRGAHAFGALTVGAGVVYSPNFPGVARHALYTEVNAAYVVNTAWSLSAVAGHQTSANASQWPDGSPRDFNYTTWNVGATYAINDHTSLDLRYWDTDQHDAGRIYRARVVAGIKATF
ncbi:uncharacterized protein (TIGR02001 family) [Luteibacter sp. Sphag1AF]|uniref:TorF family putative porin n=1 Tax=Luteibacter sp. Sphag1AF TaxID=2587031 RepID=UPI00161417BC|nr:TorF family putative porin [Luteibacter sp. Sphag1AF]MBB3228686.1 uncharacterized protein (TIGR02001 family) [Luteibacter sp. Sphag1AF]